MKLHRLASRVYDTPLAIHPSKLAVIEAVLAPRLGTRADVSADDAEMFAQQAEKREIYSVAPGGIAVIELSGTLVNRASGMDALSGLTSYDELAGELARAIADPEVKGVMLRIESPGGEAIGLSAIAQAVKAASQEKPVWASVDAYAFSAAYWIASAAERIFIPQDGECGSIGCIARHIDQSKHNETEGISVTAVYAGAQKNDFTPHAPLSDAAKERLQNDVNTLYGMFVDAVAKNRKMAKAAVRATEAGTYIGQAAIAANLADALGSFPDAMKAMSESLASGKRSAPTVIVPPSLSDAEKRGAAAGVERRQYAVADIRSESGEEPSIKGHMAVFEQWSSDVGGFIEILRPGAFTKTLKDGGDIHAYFNHDSNFVLGRVKSGTLRLSEDETGLYSENDPPDTQTVRDLVLEPIRRGDIDQGSIAFRAVRQEWGRQDGMLTRTLHEVRLYHVSPVPRGAYETTAIGLRAAASEAGIDFSAIQIAMAKQEHGLSLSDEEKAALAQSIKTLQHYLSVAPGQAAHPTGQTAEPLQALEALRTRQRRAAVALLNPA